jgi:hypothetical protein
VGEIGSESGLPDGLLIWGILEGLGLENVGTFYGIWYN